MDVVNLRNAPWGSAQLTWCSGGCREPGPVPGAPLPRDDLKREAGPSLAWPGAPLTPIFPAPQNLAAPSAGGPDRSDPGGDTDARRMADRPLPPRPAAQLWLPNAHCSCPDGPSCVPPTPQPPGRGPLCSSRRVTRGLFTC